MMISNKTDTQENLHDIVCDLFERHFGHQSELTKALIDAPPECFVTYEFQVFRGGKFCTVKGFAHEKLDKLPQAVEEVYEVLKAGKLRLTSFGVEVAG